MFFKFWFSETLPYKSCKMSGPPRTHAKQAPACHADLCGATWLSGRISRQHPVRWCAQEASSLLRKWRVSVLTGQKKTTVITLHPQIISYLLTGVLRGGRRVGLVKGDRVPPPPIPSSGKWTSLFQGYKKLFTAQEWLLGMDSSASEVQWDRVNRDVKCHWIVPKLWFQKEANHSVHRTMLNPQSVKYWSFR